MAENITAFPLAWPAGWPRTPGHTRGASAFTVKPSAALDGLHAELRRLGATNVVISSNAPTSRTGRPYAEALSERHADPGVAVYFQRKGKPTVIACDRWSHLWENIRAIGNTIEALRTIERTGASELLDRAFTGFAAIEDRAGKPRAWHEVLGVAPTASVDDAEVAYHRLAMTCHPDKGGSTEAMIELNAARFAAKMVNRV